MQDELFGVGPEEEPLLLLLLCIVGCSAAVALALWGIAEVLGQRGEEL